MIFVVCWYLSPGFYCAKSLSCLLEGGLETLAMANTSLLFYYFGHRRFSPSFRSFFFIPTCLALFTSLFILFYISTTSNLFSGQLHPSALLLKPHLPSGSSSNTQETIPALFHNDSTTPLMHFPSEKNDDGRNESQRFSKLQLGSNGMSYFESNFCFFIVCGVESLFVYLLVKISLSFELHVNLLYGLQTRCSKF